MTMGERIKQLREEHHLSQNDLAEKLGIGRTAILKYEKSQVENIPRSSIIKMSQLFGVSPAFLMGFEDWDEEQLTTEAGLYDRISAKWGEDAAELVHNYTELEDPYKKALLSISENFQTLKAIMDMVQGGSR